MLTIAKTKVRLKLQVRNSIRSTTWIAGIRILGPLPVTPQNTYYQVIRLELEETGLEHHTVV